MGKSIFTVNLPLKLFPATVAKVNIGNLKSLHTLFDKYLDHMLVDHMLVKFEQNCMVQTTQNFKLYDKKLSFSKLFLTKRWCHFAGPDPRFSKRGGRVSKLRENWLIWPQNRLNLHDLVVKRGGRGRGRIGPYLDPPLVCKTFL